MTKELELPELPTPVNATYTDDGKHRAPWPPGTHFYTADQMRAYALATLAKTQEGGEPARYFADGPQGSFFADDLKLARELVNLYDKQDDWTITDLQNPTGLTAQQKAPEGEEECETCEGRGWHDERLGGYSFSNPKAPCPDCDGTGQLSDSAAPGGDVEQRELDLLVTQWREQAEQDKAHGGKSAVQFAEGLLYCATDLEFALRGAALSAPKQVGVVPDMPESLRAKVNRYGVGGFNLSVSEYTWLCTLAASTPQAAPVPVEGDPVLWVHPGEIEAARRVKETLNGDGCVVASVFPRKEYVSLYYAPPPEQPAVDLEELNRLASDINVTSDDWTARHAPGWAVMQDFASQINALIDGAKAGRGKGDCHE